MSCCTTKLDSCRFVTLESMSHFSVGSEQSCWHKCLVFCVFFKLNQKHGGLWEFCPWDHRPRWWWILKYVWGRHWDQNEACQSSRPWLHVTKKRDDTGWYRSSSKSQICWETVLICILYVDFSKKDIILYALYSNNLITSNLQIKYLHMHSLPDIQNNASFLYSI